MPTAEAHLATDRPSRYLVQLCRHANYMGQRLRHRPRIHGGSGAPPEVRHVEWSDTHGTLNFGWGQCTMQATPEGLTLRAEATDEASLQRIQDGIAHRLEKIGRRDQLTVTWQRTEQPPDIESDQTTTETPTSTTRIQARRGTGRTIVLAAAVALAVVVHLGLLGGALAASRWTSWGISIVLAIVVVKVLFVGIHVLGVGALGRSPNVVAQWAASPSVTAKPADCRCRSVCVPVAPAAGTPSGPTNKARGHPRRDRQLTDHPGPAWLLASLR